MKKDDSFWDETMDNLDEKYIRETAEKLAEHEENVKQYAPVLLKIPENKKNEHKTAYGIAAGLAITAGLTLTAVIIANTRGIDIKPSQTCNTTPPPVAATEDSTTRPNTAIVPIVSSETASGTETEDPPKNIHIANDPDITITGEITDDNDMPKTTAVEPIFDGTAVEITTSTEARKDETERFPEALFTRELNKDLSFFETQFYGRWIGKTEEGDEILLLLTYEEDCFGAIDNNWHYLEGFYSDKSGDYMLGMSGGVHECFYIPADEPDRLYHYVDVGGPVEKKNYSFCYEREAPPSDYDTRILTSTGRIGYLGYLRIKQLTGFEMPREVAVITLDGTDWVTASSITRECGNLYANSIIQNDRLVLTKQYIRMDTIDNADSEPELQYITLYFRKKENKWEFTTAERYMSGLEPVEYDSEAYRIVSEKVDEINSKLDRETDEACTIEQSIEYFTDSDGFYYAIRRLWPSMAEEEEYDEVYWFNGTKYTKLIYEDDMGRPLVIGKILDTAFIDNYLYVYAQNKGACKALVYKNISYQKLLLNEKSEIFSYNFIGDYMIVKTYTGYSVFDISKDHTLLFKTDRLEISEDEKSFTAITPEGETFIGKIS